MFKLIVQKYGKRNSLIKAGAGKKELKENKKIIDGLIDKYIEECTGKVEEKKQ